jgi:lipooligosaccharide transport system permease protein
MITKTSTRPAPTAPAAVRIPAWAPDRVRAIVERNILIYKHVWWPLASALIEPIMYLAAIGVGVGTLVGAIPGVGVDYASFVAPAILATTAMNSAFNQTSFGVYLRIKLSRTYDAILPTPVSVSDIVLGEIASAVANAMVASMAFLSLMAATGLVHSVDILLAIPGSVLIAFAFAAAGLATTTYLRGFEDMQWIQLVMLPMYLFATTFYPLSVYNPALRPLIEILPLYQSIELIREPALGSLGWGVLTSAAYLLAFGLLATRLALRRMTGIMVR